MRGRDGEGVEEGDGNEDSE
ncbi:hypothetical protein A2U01_0065941, partial [Trifolium medium]|nr:hypothetical protein [Trifolium medium]